MKILLVFLLLPLLTTSLVSTKQAVKQALDLMLFNETYSPEYCWSDCLNTTRCGPFRPDRSRERTSGLPFINYKIKEAKFGRNRKRIRFFVPHIKTYFTARKIGEVFLIDSDRSICSAQEIAQASHRGLDHVRELLTTSKMTTMQAAKQAFNLMLFNETYAPEYCWIDCLNTPRCGPYRPHRSKQRTSGLRFINYEIKEAKFDRNETRIRFYVPHIETYFTATKKWGVFLIDSDRFICPAMGIAQVAHRGLDRARGLEQLTTYMYPRTLEQWKKSWIRCNLHMPLVYNQCIRKKVIKNWDAEDRRHEEWYSYMNYYTLNWDTCDIYQADLLKRANNDEFFEAHYVEGSDFEKVQYTSISWKDKLPRKGEKTVFTLKVFDTPNGRRFLYTHMKESCEERIR